MPVVKAIGSRKMMDDVVRLREWFGVDSNDDVVRCALATCVGLMEGGVQAPNNGPSSRTTVDEGGVRHG